MANTSADPPFKVKALFDYSSPHEDDLNFPANEIITVTAIEDNDWYYGEYDDKASGARKEGIFPINFVERVVVEMPPRPARSGGSRKKPAEEQPYHEPERPEESVRPPAAEEAAPPPPPAPAATKPSPTEAPPPPVVTPRPVEAVPPPPPPEEPRPAPRHVEPAPPMSPPKASRAPAPEAAASPSGGKPPPPEKPSSFKDRLALFNKGGAAPIAPFNPHKPPPTFVKKPYVPPPPSKNSYVPPPIQSQPKPRRDEEMALPSPRPDSPPARRSAEVERVPEEEKPKMGLKDRIALLQNQQLDPTGLAGASKPKPRPKPKRPTPTERAAAEEQHREEATSPEAAEAAVPRKSYDLSRPEIADVEEEQELPPKPKRSIDIRRDEPQFEDSSAGEADVSTNEEGRAPHRPAIHENKSDYGDDEGANEDTPDAPDTTEGEDEGEGEDEDDVDPEVARKLALRERMAKMSGGMGMYGIFGPPMGAPAPPNARKKSTGPKSDEERPRKSHDGDEHQERSPEVARPMAVPVFPMMPKVQSPPEVEKEPDTEEHNVPAGEIISERYDSEEEVDVEDMEPTHADKPHGPRPMPGMSAPVVPEDRPAPPPPVTGERPPPLPVESRPTPLLPSVIMSESAGSESDDELSRQGSKLSLDTAVNHPRAVPPHPPVAPARPSAPSSEMTTPASPPSKRLSQGYFNQPTSPIASPTTPGSTNKRASMRGAIPPIPGGITSPSVSRPPPPPPPAPARQSMDAGRRSMDSNTYRQSEDEEVTEYEADYDTDMANKVRHRDALTAQHRKEETIDDQDEETPQPSPSGMSSPPPPARSVPPPPPPPANVPPTRKSMDTSRMPSIPNSPQSSRRSMDASRNIMSPIAPPPIPQFPPQAPPQPSQLPPQAPPQLPQEEEEAEEAYEPYQYDAPRYTSPQPPPQQYAPPPPPPPPQAAPQAESRASSRGGSGRPSMDASRGGGPGRRSIDQSTRPHINDHVARDIDLGQATQWWTKPSTLPPALQPKLRDLSFEIEENSATSRGGRTTITKEVYILFHDYSQTVVTIRYDRDDPSAAALTQRHEPPPAQPRQDKLEEFQAAFGARVLTAARTREGSIVGDGQPVSLVHELLGGLGGDALPPVGTRAYGCLVYANLANASVQQYDEIRPGDIVTFRNARFQGHKSRLHQKYSTEVGKPEHVAIVVDWDGTKKKIRAYEQGRESRKVKIESFKVADLKSGEVKVWRVAGRGWVGWDSQGL